MDAIKMVGIVKYSELVRADDGIDFTIKHQEIHCLLGEDRTGKSTLMNILFGSYHPDAGEIFINEKKVPIANPNDAYALGIGMVYQYFMLVGQLTVSENITLGRESGGFFLNRRESRARMEELAERFGFKIDLNEEVVNLSVGMKQRVEILKILYRRVDVIILGKPTVMLVPQRVEELFKILGQPEKSGRIIVFITHELNETMSPSDRITVICKGKMVFCCSTQGANKKELATQMVGKQVESVVTKKGQQTGDVVLELKEARPHERAEHTMSLTARAEEILGAAEVDGNGQQELEEMIVGNRKVAGGNALLGGKPTRTLPIKDREVMGIGYIPSDCHKNVMASGFSVTENFLLGYQNTPEHCKKRFIDYDGLEQDAGKQMEVFEIKVVGMEQGIGQFSGGNQQKVILGREISHDSGLVLVAQPARELDIGAIRRVRKTLFQLKK